MFCAFYDVPHDWRWPSCYGDLHRHHVIARSKFPKNKAAKRKVKYLVENKYRHIFVRWVCAGHNVSRYADTKRGRRYLLRQRPRAEVEGALEEIRECYKSEVPELRYEALCGDFLLDKVSGSIV